MSRLVLVLLLTALPWPLEALKPDWVDRVLHNPRERTEAARQARAEGDPEAAARAADTALEVAHQLPTLPWTGDEGEGGEDDGGRPVDPRLPFNAGTAHLAAGDEERAVELLEEAARDADQRLPELAPAAHYNLGTARLADGDNGGAVEAFKNALRRDPQDAAAKHNLEVALHRLERERRLRMGDSRESPQGERPGEEETGEGEGAQQPPDEEGRSDAADPGGEEGRAEGPPDPDRPPAEDGRPPERSSALPGFQDQPDMTAEQAAAVLEAVENLERRRRQQMAAERARQGTSRPGEKDW